MRVPWPVDVVEASLLPWLKAQAAGRVTVRNRTVTLGGRPFARLVDEGNATQIVWAPPTAMRGWAFPDPIARTWVAAELIVSPID